MTSKYIWVAANAKGIDFFTNYYDVLKNESSYEWKKGTLVEPRNGRFPEQLPEDWSIAFPIPLGLWCVDLIGHAKSCVYPYYEKQKDINGFGSIVWIIQRKDGIVGFFETREQAIQAIEIRNSEHAESWIEDREWSGGRRKWDSSVLGSIIYLHPFYV